MIQGWRLARRGVLALFAGAAIASLSGCQTTKHQPANAELVALTSGGFKAALQSLTPGYEQATGADVRIDGGPSMGTTRNAIPARLSRNEPADVVILVREALDELAAAGKVDRDTITDLARSRIAMVVKTGAPAPDISTVAALRSTLLSAQSIAYSDSASGVHMSTRVFPQLGIAEQMASRARMIPATPVGEIVAQGGAEIGFQQLSELKAVHGVTIVGLIPDEVQKVTMFSAGIVSYSARKSEAARLIDYLASSQAKAAIVASGMDPATPHD